MVYTLQMAVDAKQSSLKGISMSLTSGSTFKRYIKTLKVENNYLNQIIGDTQSQSHDFGFI